MQWTPECKREFASLVDLGTFSDEGTKMGSWSRAKEMLLSSYKAQMYIWYKTDTAYVWVLRFHGSAVNGENAQKDFLGRSDRKKKKLRNFLLSI